MYIRFFTVLLIAISTTFPIHLEAQQGRKPMMFLEVEEIGRDKMQCTYRYSVVEEGDTSVGYLNLQIGGTLSKCCGYKTFQMDSLGLVLGNKLYDTRDLAKKWNNINKISSNVDWTVYDNFPIGKVTITDRIFMDQYESPEPRNTLFWNTSYEESQEILGHRCLKATIDAWGRRWEAWYAPDIPLTAGPWELRGLPGLILRAADATGEHRFEAVSIRQTNEPIVYRKAKYFKYDRDRVVREKIKFKGNVSAYTEGHFSLQQSADGKPSPPRVKSLPYNPLRIPAH